MTSTRNNELELPADMLGEIAGQMSTADAREASGVCRLWRQAMTRRAFQSIVLSPRVLSGVEGNSNLCEAAVST